MSAKLTKWKVYDGPQINPMFSGIVCMIAANDQMLAVITEDEAPVSPYDWPDIAHLIAAAPELYAELDMQVRNCPVCKGEGFAVDIFDILTRDSPKKTPCNRCTSSRRALSLAKGEQP